MGLRPSRRVAPAVSALTALTFVLAACGGDSEPTGGGEPVVDADFQVSVSQDPGCLDPHQTQLRQALQWGRQLADSLIYENADGEWTPWLATDWTVNDNATEFTFDLRDDVTFTDGSAFDAETVKANLDSLKAMDAVASVAVAYLRDYVETQVLSPTQVKILFSAPNAQFLYGLSTPSFGMYSTATAGLSPEARCAGDFVGSGPFTVEEYTQNERVVLTRNDDYAWGPDDLENTGAAYLKTATYNVISDSSTISGAALSGETDLAFGIADQDVESLREAGWQNSDVPEPALSAGWVVLLGSGPAGNDPAVREALKIGIDREALSGAMTSLMSPATGVLNDAHPYHLDQSADLAYDPEGARAALEGSGWVEGADGIYEKAGQRLSTNVILYTDGAQEIMELAKQQLAEVGIELTITPVTANEAAARRTAGDFELRIDWFTGPEPTVISNILLENTPPQQITDLIAEQATTTDFDTRKTIVDELQTAVLDESILIPIWQQNSTPFWGPQVQGMTRDVAGLAMLSQIQKTE